MNEEVGKGFARQVTKSNLAKFAPLLRDRVREPTESSPASGTAEVQEAQSLFDGSKVRVSLPFTFPSSMSGITTATKTCGTDPESSEGEDSDDPVVSHPVLVAEIPGPGRWSQASFSRDFFFGFFGGRSVDLTYIDAQGAFIQETANPIVKASSNYCYELRAAVGLNYPSRNTGRPIGVFVRVGPEQFQYRLVMPSDQDHTLLDMFLADNWEGPAGRMRRITTDLDALLGTWPAAQLPFVVSGTTGS